MFTLRLTQTAYESLGGIRDPKARREVLSSIDGLAEEPDGQGKPLQAPLDGLRSIRATRSRYRVIYRSDPRKRRVVVLLVGERRPGEASDVYQLAQRLVRTLLRDG